MDYGQPTQLPDSPELFSVGQGVNDPNVNNFESENNLSTENWNVAPDKNPGSIGNKTISSTMQNEMGPLPFPSTEAPTMPSEVYNPTSESLSPSSIETPIVSSDTTTPELGQIISVEPLPSEQNIAEDTVDQSKENLISSFTWKQAMSRDRLSNSYVHKFDDSIKELDATGDIAAFTDFWAKAGEHFRDRGASLGSSKEAA